jgi:hypothetical protein
MHALFNQNIEVHSKKYKSKLRRMKDSSQPQSSLFLCYSQKGGNAKFQLGDYNWDWLEFFILLNL